MTRSWKRYVTALILNMGITFLVLYLRGFDRKIYYVDAFSVGGAVSILLGLLVWVAIAGAFDTIGYGFSVLVTDRKYKDLYEYTARKKEKRDRQGKPYVPYMVVGVFFWGISFLISMLPS